VIYGNLNITVSLFFSLDVSLLTGSSRSFDFSNLLFMLHGHEKFYEFILVGILRVALRIEMSIGNRLELDACTILYKFFHSKCFFKAPVAQKVRL